MKKLLKNKIVISFGVAVFWLVVWEIAALAVDKSVLLPSPVATALTLFELAKDGSFWLSCLYSLGRIALGFTIGTLFGTVIGFICFKSSLVKTLLHPLQGMIKATPVASFIILALVWIGKNSIPSFTAFLMVTPIVWSGVYSSLISIDRNLTETLEIFPLPLIKRIKYLYIPSMKKKYVASLETALGLAWKAGIAAEVLCIPKTSMGTELYYSKIYIETEKLFAWTLCVIVISIVLEFAMKRLLGKLLSGNGGNNGTSA